MTSLLFDPPAIHDPVKIAQEGRRQLRARALEPRLRKIELDLANHRADSEGDPISLIKERSELQRQLRQPVGLPELSRNFFVLS
jgi:DNA primase